MIKYNMFFNNRLIILISIITLSLNVYAQEWTEWTGPYTEAQEDVIGNDIMKSLLQIKGTTIEIGSNVSDYEILSQIVPFTNYFANVDGLGQYGSTTGSGIRTKKGTYKRYTIKEEAIGGSYSYGTDYPWRKLDLSPSKYTNIETIGDVTRYTLITETNENPFLETVQDMNIRLAGSSKWIEVGDNIVPIYKIYKYIGEKRTDIIDGNTVEIDIIRYEVFIRNISMREFLLGNSSDNIMDSDTLTTIDNSIETYLNSVETVWGEHPSNTSEFSYTEIGKSDKTLESILNGWINISTALSASNNFFSDLGISINLSYNSGSLELGELRHNYIYIHNDEHEALREGSYVQYSKNSTTIPSSLKIIDVPIENHKIYFKPSTNELAVIITGGFTYNLERTSNSEHFPGVNYPEPEIDINTSITSQSITIPATNIHAIATGGFSPSLGGFGGITEFDLSGGGGPDPDPDPEDPEDPITLVRGGEVSILFDCENTITLTGKYTDILITEGLLFKYDSSDTIASTIKVEVEGVEIPAVVSRLRYGLYLYDNDVLTHDSNVISSPINLSEHPELWEHLNNGRNIYIELSADLSAFVEGDEITVTITTTDDESNEVIYSDTKELSDCSNIILHTKTPAHHLFEIVEDETNYPHVVTPAIIHWDSTNPVEIFVLKTLTDPNGVQEHDGLTPMEPSINGLSILNKDDYYIHNVKVYNIDRNSNLEVSNSLVTHHNDARTILFNPNNEVLQGVLFITYDVTDKNTNPIDPITVQNHLIIYNGGLAVPDPLHGGSDRLTSTSPTNIQIGKNKTVSVANIRNATTLDIFPDGSVTSGVSAYYILRTTSCFFIHPTGSAPQENYFLEGVASNFTGEVTTNTLPSNITEEFVGYQSCLDHGNEYYYTRVPFSVTVDQYTPSNNYITSIDSDVRITHNTSTKWLKIYCK